MPHPVVKVLLVALLALVLSVALRGAAAQPVDLDILRTYHEAPVREAPQPDAAVSFTVPGRTHLIWAVSAEHDGFYRVIRENQGPQGWIAKDDVEILHQHQHHDLSGVKACAPSLTDCPMRGCAVEGSPEALANEMKRTAPKQGEPVTLDFADMKQLQGVADERVGEGPQDMGKAQHDALNHLPVAHGTVSEGDAVRMYGYIAKGEDGLHYNKSGESVNCLLKNADDNDIHIPLVAQARDTEYQGIVVEMVPEGRPPGWTVDALQRLQTNGARVWVEGGLSYDKYHYVNADKAHAFKDEPARVSLWEVHPITKFLVCRKEHCADGNADDWSALDAK